MQIRRPSERARKVSDRRHVRKGLGVTGTSLTPHHTSRMHTSGVSHFTGQSYEGGSTCRLRWARNVGKQAEKQQVQSGSRGIDSDQRALQLTAKAHLISSSTSPVSNIELLTAGDILHLTALPLFPAGSTCPDRMGRLYACTPLLCCILVD